MSVPLCDNCLKGNVIPGEPTGTEETIGAFLTYVAKPPVSKAKNKKPAARKAIILLTDIFGLASPNPRIMADTMALAGFTAYVPDLFDGEGQPLERMGHPDTPGHEPTGIFAKLKLLVTMATLAPFFFRHWPSNKTVGLNAFIDLLKSDRGHTRIGLVGYCYGAKVAVLSADHADAMVLCHPSMIEVVEVVDVKIPMSFAFAEEDGQTPPPKLELYRKVMEGKTAEIVVYEGTTHGFASRPNVSIELVKAGYEGSMKQTTGWFAKHL